MSSKPPAPRDPRGLIQRDGRYASSLRARFDGPFRDLAPTITADFTASGVDHDASFAPAGVAPERANLMTLESAAACAFLDPKRVPPPVHAALRSAFGADEPFAMRALGR